MKNLFSYFLFIASLITSSPSFSFSECGNRSRPGNYHELENLDIGLKNVGEVKATDLDWKDGSKLPKEASKYIEKHAQISINQFALFDLNKDGIDEIIIMSSSLGGSGGAGFMFLEKQSGKWTELINFTGGFILSHLDIPKPYNYKYYTITQWRRYGASDTRQSLLAYKNHKYQFINEQPVPLTVIYSKEFQKMLLHINWMCSATWN